MRRIPDGESLKARYEAWTGCEATWDMAHPDKPGFVHFDDDFMAALGADPTGARFEQISKRMLGGHYYPADVIVFYSPRIAAGEQLRAGDRILQVANLWFVTLFSIAEIVVAEREGDRCVVGYITTRRHFARGWWRAELTRANGELSLRVRSLAMPGSLLYWLGIPVARWLQLRARRRSIEGFRALN